MWKVPCFVAVSLVLAACSRDNPEARAPASPPAAPTAEATSASAPASVPAAPLTTSAATPAPPAAPAAPSAPAIAAWTDAAIVDELARDCKYKPPEAAASEGDPSPLSCASGLYEQSCAVDPCYSTDQRECKPRCEKTCDRCGEQCAASCTQCKARCTDETCKRSCAAACGSCRQECLAAKDRCATGTCAEEYKRCSDELVTRWKQSGCPKGCEGYNQCTAKCEGGGSLDAAAEKAWEKCRARCAAQLKRVCPASLSEMCMFNGSGPIDEP
ncbi:MAG: hypothetical protein ACOY0T_06740 [Myxococcota bacterium]